MLRCPKCNRIYQDGPQKFCMNDGQRLMLVDDSLSPVEDITPVISPRLTPPGELLTEATIMPPLENTHDSGNTGDPSDGLHNKR